MIQPTGAAQNYVTNYGDIRRGTLRIDPTLKDKSLEDILTDAGLNFPVYMARNSFTTFTGKVVESRGYSVYNGLTDVELGFGVTSEYHPLSYPEILNHIFVDVKNLGGIPTRAINFNGGRRAAIQFNFPEDSYNIGGQEHKTFYNVYASHDGTTGIVVNGSDVRIICGNTYRMSLSDQTLKSSFKHTENVESKLDELQETFTFTQQQSKPYYEVLNSGIAVPASFTVQTAFLNAMIPDGKPSAKTGRINQGPANRRIELGNAIGATAAERGTTDITFYDLLEGTFRFTSYAGQDAKNPRDEAEQFDYVMSKQGQGRKLNSDAFEWVRENL